MTFIENLIKLNNLQAADVIVLRKKLFGMVDHFAVFLGYDLKRKPILVANYTQGTKRISQQELNNFLKDLTPERIERFEGTNSQRLLAVKRGLSKIGENNYNYLENNCEHYASYVQKGIPASKQAASFKEAAGVTLGAALIALLIDALGGE